MYKIYKKNETNFSLILIAAYVILLSLADRISNILGIEKIITVIISTGYAIFLLSFIKKYGLKEKYGLIPFKGNLKNYLYFIPLIIISTTNLWNGVSLNLPILESVIYIINMIGVGFLEEIIFRGFLFKSLIKDNLRLAIIISSLSFGLGHLANLLNGRDFWPTLLQVFYACAIGFLFTIIFLKGKSLYPCIISHILINTLSVFAIGKSSTRFDIITVVLILIIVSISYGLWIIKKEG